MANPSSRQGLIDYCLRRLGHPVLEINVDDDQIEDRLDEALQYYREFHFDAVELVYLSAKVEASSIDITGLNASDFTPGERITGQTSGASAFIITNTDANTLSVKDVSDTDFTPGESFVGFTSGASATLSSITKGNYDNKYFDISDSVIGVNRVLPFTSKTRGIDLFDVRYQILINDLYSIQSSDLIYYSQVQTQLSLMNDLLVGEKPVRFNRHMNRLYVDMDYKQDVEIGDYIIVEGYRILDPDTFTDVYNDMMLKRYTTALIKLQWGTNLKKFEGVQLPGGVTLNGQQIFNEAQDELKELEREMDSTYQLPVDFFVG